MGKKEGTALRLLLALPVRDRARAACALLGSLRGQPDPQAEEAWSRELKRRAAEIDRGEARLVDWRTVQARLRRLYGS